MKKFGSVLLATTILIGSSAPSWAYYSKINYTESFEIQANQSAFLIPLQGANRDNQAQFGSKEYFQQNKVPAKRIEIPHMKLSGSGSFQDYWIPAAKLIIVDRAPYNRTWTDSSETGTSTKKQGFHFESADSLEIETDVTIAASVREEDAAMFLYYFGTVSQVNPIPYDPTAQYQTDAYYAQTYASISYGRSLADVMDTVGHGKVQEELALEFGKYPLDIAITKKAEIMKTVSDRVIAYFKERGITIEYLGYANGLNFDPSVQTAINGVFVATKEAQAISAGASVIPVRQQMAQVKVTENFGQSLLKWSGNLPNLPSFTFLPSNVVDWVSGFFYSKPESSKKTS